MQDHRLQTIEEQAAEEQSANNAALAAWARDIARLSPAARAEIRRRLRRAQRQNAELEQHPERVGAHIATAETKRARKNARRIRDAAAGGYGANRGGSHVCRRRCSDAAAAAAAPGLASVRAFGRLRHSARTSGPRWSHQRAPAPTVADETDTAPDQSPPAEPVTTFAEFLVSTPPGVKAHVSNVRAVRVPMGPGFAELVAAPTIQLHCGFESCGGLRFFALSGSRPDFRQAAARVFLTYVCKNCGKTSKTYALWLVAAPGKEAGLATKYGELPPFGPPTPPRVISLIGPDRDAYFKGRRAENQGLGIGAFAYYRRIVEEQKSRLIDEIIRVAERTGAPDPMIATLKAARDETQFSKAVDTIKDGIPDSLKIHGHNPLVLLHSALSEGLHAQTDEECLELASSIRIVLEELAERAAIALKDHAELKSAVTRLLNKR